jgi:hypothetical protein
LSRTGQLIGTLLAGARDGKGGAAVALPLNGTQAIAASPPNSGTDLLPLLKQAIVQSGMFYEAHQAEWVEGRYSKAQLLQEPQGRLPPTTTPAQQGATAQQGLMPAARSENAAARNSGEPAAAARPSSTAGRERSRKPRRHGGQPGKPQPPASRLLASAASGRAAAAGHRPAATRSFRDAEFFLAGTGLARPAGSLGYRQRQPRPAQRWRRLRRAARSWQTRLRLFLAPAG